MSNILVEERKVVIPGEALPKGLDYFPGEKINRKDKKINSTTKDKKP